MTHDAPSADHWPLSAAARSVPGSAIRALLADARRPGMISLAGGLPAPELIDAEGLRACADATLAEGPLALQYGPTEGQPALRMALARWMAARGVRVAPEEILVTSGSQQGIDLVARALVDPGDLVIVERPGYLAALQALRLTGARVATIGVDADGARVEELDAVVAAHGRAPKLVYLVPDFANPSGARLSLARREALVAWARDRRVPVIEDAPYAELRFAGDPMPSLAALAQARGAADWVGHLSTLSKLLAPGLRVGWACLPAPLHEAVVRIKQACDLHTGSFAQEVAARYLDSGRLEPRLPAVRATYAARADALVAALRARFGDALAFEPPGGGMFVWARFTAPLDTTALLGRARDEGVIFVPGADFHAEHPDRSTLRLGYATVDPAALAEGVARLHRAWRAAVSDPACAASTSAGRTCSSGSR